MNFLLADLPMPIKTKRLSMRSPQIGDGMQLYKAITDSYEQLHMWMSWADHKPTPQESEVNVRKLLAKYILREELTLFIFDAEEKDFLGAVSYKCLDWTVPKFEIGYWVNQTHAGQGIITEATRALVLYGFKQLKAKRIEIRCDEDNVASRKVAEKTGFVLEATLKNDQLKLQSNSLRNTVIYARYDAHNVSDNDISW